MKGHRQPASSWAVFAEAALALRGDALRSDALASAIRACGPEVPAELAAAARALRDMRQHALLLGQIALLAQPVDEYLLAQALSEADRCGHVRLRIDTVVEMVRRAGVRAIPVFDALFEHFDRHPLLALQAFRDVAPWLDNAMAYRVFEDLPWHRLSRVSGECADLLCALAPALGAAGLPALVRALPRVCGERHGTRALARLAAAITDDESQSAALETALAMTVASWRAQALIGIAGQLNADRQQLVLRALVETSRQAEKARRLLCVRPLIDPAAMPLWRAVVASMDQPELASALLSSQVDALPGTPADAVRQPTSTTPPPSEAAIDAAGRALGALLDELPERSSVASASRRPAARVPLPGLAELLARLEMLEAEPDRFEAVESVLPGLGSADRALLLERLPAYFGPDRLDLACMRIATGLTGADRQVLVARLDCIDEPARLGRLIRGLHLQAADDLRDALLRSLRKGMDSGVRTDRPALVRFLCAWAPVTIRMGSEETALQLIEAIDEVGRMWP